MTDYKYLPLNPARREIRILNLLPRCKVVGVQCTIKHVSMDEDPKYMAVSYAWGDPTPTHRIEIEGCQLAVAESAKVLLEHLVHERIPMKIWIDAVCIDQSNDEEKSVQIRMMGAVFGRALCVIAWLGPESDDSRDGINMAECLSLALTEELRTSVDIRTAIAKIVDRLDLRNPAIVKSIMGLFRRALWHRLWVLQELVLAKVLYFQCGKERIRGSVLPRAALTLGYSQDWRVELEDSLRSRVYGTVLVEYVPLTDEPCSIAPLLTPLLELGLDMGITDRPGRYSLSYLLNCTTAQRLFVSDHRDRIFGLLGLASDASALNIDVNYLQSPQELCIKTALSFIRLQGFEILGNCRHKRYHDLPSWVPDWTPNPRSTRLYDRQEKWVIPLPRFMACGSISQNLESLCFVAEAGALCLSATVVGTLQAVGPPPMLGTLTQSFHESLEPVLIPWSSTLRWLKEVDVFLRGSLQDKAVPTSVMSQHTNSSSYVREVLWRVPLAGGTLAYSATKEIKEILEWNDCSLASFTKALHARICKQTTVTEIFRRSFDYHAFAKLVTEMATYKQPFVTQNGYAGLGPDTMKEGDVVVILPSGHVPYVLRPIHKQQSKQYRLVGEAYVYGVMYGEHMTMNPKLEEIILR